MPTPLANLRCACAVMALFNLASCSWMDHRKSSDLERELVERSKQGLALASWPTPSERDLVIGRFNGEFGSLHPNCCPPATFHTIWRSLIVTVDLTSAPALDPLKDPPGVVKAISRYGGPLTEVNTRGEVVARSIPYFRPAPMSVAPDGEHFAILSAPLDHPEWPAGVYIGAFHETSVRNLMNLHFKDRYDSFTKAPLVDWSPQSDFLLVSHLGQVYMIDTATGRSRIVTGGGAAMWSPVGGWISYVMLSGEIALLNLTTGQSKRIDPGRQMVSTPKWSADGRYLLIPEGDGGYVIGGCLWVYRISDASWLPLSGFAVSWPSEWYWIQLQQAKA